MIELTLDSDECYRWGIAGDTYNTASVLAGLGHDVHYITALGTSALADKIRKRSATHNIKLLEPKDENSAKLPGLYMIDNDEFGERSFDYWRDNSAAKQLFESPELFRELLKQSIVSSSIYFSGITLALLSDENRGVLKIHLQEYRQQGGKVFFDPNYRANLWMNKKSAAEEIEKILPYIDVYLPSFEDEVALYGANSEQALLEHYSSIGVKEIILKCGSSSCLLFHNDSQMTIPTDPARKVLDSTGAGDTFNGGYLAARLLNGEPEVAITFAKKAASKILAVRGGILSAEQLADLQDILSSYLPNLTQLNRTY